MIVDICTEKIISIELFWLDNNYGILDQYHLFLAAFKPLKTFFSIDSSMGTEQFEVSMSKNEQTMMAKVNVYQSI